MRDGYEIIMIDNVQSLISDFVTVARLAGFSIASVDITHEMLHAPHRPVSLPFGKQAVYVFSLTDVPQLVLKVGKVGSNSNARFLSQHYNPKSSNSNLSKSLLKDQSVWVKLGISNLSEINVGEWVKQNTDRDNFYLNSDFGLPLLSLLEVFLQCRLQPIFEG
jgi:hypothetical protein